MESLMARKDKKAKLPKQVGGVKVPKDLRKSAKTMVELAKNPIAREVVSAAIVAGAAALTRRKVAAKAPHVAEPQERAPATDPEKKGAELANLLMQGVTAFLGGLTRPSERKPPSEAKPAAAAREPATAASKPAAASRKPAATPGKTSAAPRKRTSRPKPKE